MTTEHSAPPSTGRARLVIVAVMASWLVFPLVHWGTGAQDAVPFLVAGYHAVAGDHAEIYGSDGQVMSDDFRARSCDHLGPSFDCSREAVPFISPPSALLPGIALGALPADVGATLLRLLSAAALAGGLGVLWRRLRVGDPDADRTVAIVAALLTPYAFFVTSIGQNTPLLFLSACLGLGASPTLRGDLGRSALWAATIATKAFPAALVLTALAARRGRFVVAGAAWSTVLLVLSTAITEPDLLGDFLHSADEFRERSLRNPANASSVALAHQHVSDHPALEALLLGSTAALVGSLWWWRVRRAMVDVRWAWSWVALVALLPTSWWHYGVLTVAAVALALVARPPARRPAWALPATAAATSLLALPIGYGLTTQVLQVALVVATLVAVARLCTDETPASDYPLTPTSPTTNVPSS
jgi:hypothetical protein